MPAEKNFQLSVLDLSPVSSGSTSAEALRNTVDLAQLADALGYTRYWLAEHHSTRLIASSVPEVMIGHVASATRRIRVGSGGVMLPNHSPLHVAEAFRVLEALHPGRIDLGLGRAPGTDTVTALALRRSRQAVFVDEFPQQLDELLGFLSDDFAEEHPFRHVKAMPMDVGTPEIWLLGSSDFSAQLAAKLGLGFAFAHHIQPSPAIATLRMYRNYFRPSKYFAEPKALVGVSVVCAESDERAAELARPAELSLLRLRQGRLGRLPSVAEATEYPYTREEREMIRLHRDRIFVGSPETVHGALSNLAERCGVDEIMITSLIYDHRDRRRSYELLAKTFGLGTEDLSRPPERSAERESAAVEKP
jgi:luciferase family oxidoreductase group 1